jgi:hypothetical protein
MIVINVKFGTNFNIKMLLFLIEKTSLKKVRWNFELKCI